MIQHGIVLVPVAFLQEPSEGGPLQITPFCKTPEDFLNIAETAWHVSENLRQLLADEATISIPDIQGRPILKGPPHTKEQLGAIATFLAGHSDNTIVLRPIEKPFEMSE